METHCKFLWNKKNSFSPSFFAGDPYKREICLGKCRQRLWVDKWTYIWREREREELIILELSWLENPANIYMWHMEHWTTVSILLGLISCAHHNLHHWRSNQKRRFVEAKTLPLGHRFMSHVSDAESTSDGDNAWPLDIMFLEGIYSLLRTRPHPGPRHHD